MADQHHQTYMDRTPKPPGSTASPTPSPNPPGDPVRYKLIAYDDYDLIAAPIDDLNKTMSLDVIR